MYAVVKHGHKCKLQYTGAIKQMAKTGQIFREWPFGWVGHVFISAKRHLVIYSLYVKVQWMKCSQDLIVVNASCFAKFAKYSLTKIRAYTVLAKLQLLSSTQYHSFHVPAVKLHCQLYSSTFRQWQHSVTISSLSSKYPTGTPCRMMSLRSLLYILVIASFYHRLQHPIWTWTWR